MGPGVGGRPGEIVTPLKTKIQLRRLKDQTGFVQRFMHQAASLNLASGKELRVAAQSGKLLYRRRLLGEVPLSGADQMDWLR